MKTTETRALARWLAETIQLGAPKAECDRLRALAIKRLKRQGKSEAHARVILTRAWQMAKLPPIGTWNMTSRDFCISVEERLPQIAEDVADAMIELGEDFERLLE